MPNSEVAMMEEARNGRGPYGIRGQKRGKILKKDIKEIVLRVINYSWQ